MDMHRKGSAWRREVEVWLQSYGASTTSRGIGLAGDDIEAGWAGLLLSVECKNTRAIDLAGFVDQAERQAGPGRVPVCFIKRRGRAGVPASYVVLSASSFASLLARRPTYTDVNDRMA